MIGNLSVGDSTSAWRLRGGRRDVDDRQHPDVDRGHLRRAVAAFVVDSSAVVDQHLRVHGLERSRVADTSVFPVIPSRGPNATAIMLGERLADLSADAPSLAGDRAPVGEKA